MSKSIFLALTCLIAIGLIASAIYVGAEERKAVHVGSETCQGCHDAQYDSFMADHVDAVFEVVTDSGGKKKRSGLSQTEIPCPSGILFGMSLNTSRLIV